MHILGGKEEQFWHRCFLATLLVIAACTRFYSIDYHSLSFYELAQLAACDQSSWLKLLNYYVGFTGLPPLYPTLLCTVTDWFSESDFFIRALSAVTGLASIYFLYLTGRDFFSATTGLLAAALMAVNYQIILLDREISINSLLFLCYLAHGYCFCHLFLGQTTHQVRPMKIHFSGTRSSIEWCWEPDFPGEGRWIVGFWLTAALAFYTSNMSLLLFFMEFIASAFLLSRRHPSSSLVRTWLRNLWVPIFIIILPWFPILSRYWKPIFSEGYIFGIHKPIEVWEKIQLLLPTDPLLLYASILLLIAFIIFIVVVKVINKKTLPGQDFIWYISFLWCISIVALWTIKSDYSSYAYLCWISVLVLVLPIAYMLEKIPQGYLQLLVLGFLVLANTAIQIRSNVVYDLYHRTRGSDFRLTAKIIHDDREFQNTRGIIILSNKIFDHYLRAYGLVSSHLIVENNHPSENLDTALKHTEFYYLDFIPEKNTESEVFKRWALQYRNICTTKIPPKIRLAKFSIEKNPATTNSEIDCREYLADRITLK